MFPLTSALHVKASALSADGAVGQVLTFAAPGQLAGPLIAGAIAQAAGLRAGLLILPALSLTAAAATPPSPLQSPGCAQKALKGS